MLEKWWRYRIWSAGILLVILVAVGYLITANTQSVSYDFYVGVVTGEPMPQEVLDDLQQRLDAAAWDRNHDNTARVLVWTYTVKWNPDGTISSDQAEFDKLKADLGSKMSGMLLVDNPQGMPLETEAVPVEGMNLYAMLSPGHMETKTYAAYLEKLLQSGKQ